VGEAFRGSYHPIAPVSVAVIPPDPSFIYPSSRPTARFSPDDKFSKQRLTLKKRFNLLPTQQAERVL
jgi:hypothetical protein